MPTSPRPTAGTTAPRAVKAGGSATAPPAAVEAPRPATYHHGNLRDALVLRGVEILDTEGAAALTLRRAARDVGVSQTAPLHHFEGKAAYLAAIAAHGFRLLFEQRIGALRHKTDPRERLLAVMLAHLQFAVDHGALFHVMFGPDIPDKAQFPDLEQAARRSYGILETAVGEYLSSRDVPLARTRRAALAAWTACHGMATLMVDRQNAWDIVRKDAPLKIGGDVFSIFIAGLDHA
ncbi:TetR/AcrR family transcriptional regulator [Aquabacterium sp. J223]|uniref:TetR/AcrR family transcriptional regulator n=1 Tax=Aquabacterium sp. J223 TaxID=2898431 RepID=UPI0021AD87F7|nr:TetR-like C-terminal domain-containing protein [Aquabacterium sp. J223]UUX95209.1 WHG domain-containing protein [Aquabacterium sp. J223]